MKKPLALLLGVCLSLSCMSALADGRTAPADQSEVITTDKVNGHETYYRKYDGKFYDAPSEQPGTVERLSYTTEVYGEPIENWVNVYLPYGYDPDGEQRYDILYFYHGTNETQDSFIGNERVKNCVDNMIEVGVAPPFIMVCPTYYYDYAMRACDLDLFQEEMRCDVMPAVESAYRTYAQTPDDAGFAASREHRAFAGYSQGCRMCWYSFHHLLDTAYFYLPMSNAVGAQGIVKAIDAQADYKDDFFVYIGCGGKRDDLQTTTVNLVNELIKQPEYFRFGKNPGTDNIYLTISQDVHQTLIGRFFLYNAFCDVLWK